MDIENQFSHEERSRIGLLTYALEVNEWIENGEETVPIEEYRHLLNCYISIQKLL